MSDLIRRLAFQLGGKPPVAPKPYSPKGSIIVAGHESPHKFDQYSLDHMGKGEGAQSFTKGLYFWEDPSVGRHYNKQFKRPGWEQDTFFKPPEREIANHLEMGAWDQELKSLEGLRGRLPPEVVRYRDSGQLKAAGAELENWAQRQLIDRYGDEKAARAALDYSDHYQIDPDRDALGLLAGWTYDEDGILNGLGAEDWLNLPGGTPGNPGFTYHTKIHADRADMPNYRLPFGKQPRHLREPLRNVLVGLIDQIDGPSLSHPTDFNRRNKLLDRDAFRRPFEALSVEALRDVAEADAVMARHTRRPPLLQPSGHNHPALGPVESAMLDEGIPGVRYGAVGGRSPRENFVIYDPKYLEIVKRYPYALLGPLLAPAATSPADTDRR